MYIQEAVKQAMEQNLYIHNPQSTAGNYVYMKPTNNSKEGFVGYHKNGNEPPSPRWQPRADDLISDGWELYSPGVN